MHSASGGNSALKKSVQNRLLSQYRKEIETVKSTSLFGQKRGNVKNKLQNIALNFLVDTYSTLKNRTGKDVGTKPIQFTDPEISSVVNDFFDSCRVHLGSLGSDDRDQLSFSENFKIQLATLKSQPNHLPFLDDNSYMSLIEDCFQSKTSSQFEPLKASGDSSKFKIAPEVFSSVDDSFLSNMFDEGNDVHSTGRPSLAELKDDGSQFNFPKVPTGDPLLFPSVPTGPVKMSHISKQSLLKRISEFEKNFRLLNENFSSDSGRYVVSDNKKWLENLRNLSYIHKIYQELIELKEQLKSSSKVNLNKLDNIFNIRVSVVAELVNNLHRVNV